jgi:hypothetical protein
MSQNDPKGCLNIREKLASPVASAFSMVGLLPLK